MCCKDDLTSAALLSDAVYQVIEVAERQVILWLLHEDDVGLIYATLKRKKNLQAVLLSTP